MLFNYLKKIINYTLIRLFNIQLVTSRSIKYNKTARKIFLNRKIVENKTDGYWKLDPMPTNEELFKYYNNVYWGSREPLADITSKDLTHYHILKKNVCK